MKKPTSNPLWLLFSSMFTISMITFGGGFVIVNFMRRRFVDGLKWISEEEMLDITSLAQSSPGPIAVNAAILLGWRKAGMAGMISAMTGTVLPPMILLSAISLVYTAFASNTFIALFLKGMQCGVAAVILDVVCSLGANALKKDTVRSCTIMLAAFIATMFFHVNVNYVIIAAAVIGAVNAVKLVRKERRT